ncbi:hypothetical protein ACFU7Y_20555 [Kitasatospora sp. NPDC057542]|uniref:hypothetical protein n=1 Tax=Kitasatospora sp. NPDC057542 TaxID=3346162 RepID=UPI0036AADCD4
MRKIALGLLALLLITASGLSVILMAAAGDAKAAANTATCTGVIDPVGTGQQGPGTAPAATGWNDASDQNGQAVVVPMSPQGPQQTPQWSDQQRRNAATITNVARTRNLSPRAAVIAVATAMQESTLENLTHGDRDSLGLFQQRPSQGWGSATQITDPVYASNGFYDVLVKTRDWQTRPLTDVAADVQRPDERYRKAYAKWEQSAAGLVSTTWGSAAVTSVYKGCDTTTPTTDQATTTDPTGSFTTHNPRTTAQAIAAARAASTSGRSDFHRLCDNFVAQAYGWGSSGSDSANVHWQRLVATGDAHPGDNAPPAGALLFYDSGSAAGHVALYLGNDMVASNDIAGDGIIGIRPRADFTNGTWRLRYRGWAAPSFPSAGGTSTLPVPGGAT